MSRFIVREYKQLPGGEVLISLQDIIARLPVSEVCCWCFREVELTAGEPYGMALSEFERLSSCLMHGFCVAHSDFLAFLAADFQVVNGSVDAYTGSALGSPLFCVECVDSSQWEITTASDELAQELEKTGLVREAPSSQ